MNQTELSKQFSRGGSEADAANEKIERLISKTNGNLKRMAEGLGISRTSLYRLIKRKRGYMRLVKQARAGE